MMYACVRSIVYSNDIGFSSRGASIETDVGLDIIPVHSTIVTSYYSCQSLVLAANSLTLYVQMLK